MHFIKLTGNRVIVEQIYKQILYIKKMHFPVTSSYKGKQVELTSVAGYNWL